MYDKIWAVHSFLMPDGYNLSFVRWKLNRNILINAFSMKTQNKPRIKFAVKPCCL